MWPERPYKSGVFSTDHKTPAELQIQRNIAPPPPEMTRGTVGSVEEPGKENCKETQMEEEKTKHRRR